MSDLDEVREKIAVAEAELKHAREVLNLPINEPGVVALNQKIVALYAKEERLASKTESVSTAAALDDDPVISGIYEQLSQTDSEPSVNNFVTFGPKTFLVRQEWIDLKNEILTERADTHKDSRNGHKSIFLRGKSGRGKSSFVYYLMYCILLKAKESRKRKVDTGRGFIVGFVKSDRNNNIIYNLLTVEGYRTVSAIPRDVFYYISDIKGDEPSTNLAQCFTMVVASDDEGKSEFLKRIAEAGDSASILVMPSPTRQQMHIIFQQHMSTEEINFRLDVVGCNPRYFRMGTLRFTPSPDYQKLIQETCAEILRCFDTDPDPSRFNWVMSVVMQRIETATKDENKLTLNSLFHEDVVEGLQVRRVYSSTFMCFLAGKIRDKFRDNPMDILTTLFGRSGVGNCHEYDAHNFFCGLMSSSHPCWCSRTKRWVNVPFGTAGPRTKVLFRNINDISNVLAISSAISSRYLLPSVTNLALIDSIIPPAIVLQMTVSESHRGATDKVADILRELNDPATLVMIFVLPEEIVATFKFPTALPDRVHMYLTVVKPMTTLAEARKIK